MYFKNVPLKTSSMDLSHFRMLGFGWESGFGWAFGLWRRFWTLWIVLESPVRSGYWAPSGSNRDRDRLVFSWKPNLTGPNRYKPVISQLASVMLRLHNWFKTGHGYNQLLTGYNRSFTYIYFITNLIYSISYIHSLHREVVLGSDKANSRWAVTRRIHVERRCGELVLSDDMANLHWVMTQQTHVGSQVMTW